MPGPRDVLPELRPLPPRLTSQVDQLPRLFCSVHLAESGRQHCAEACPSPRPRATAPRADPPRGASQCKSRRLARQGRRWIANELRIRPQGLVDQGWVRRKPSALCPPRCIRASDGASLTARWPALSTAGWPLTSLARGADQGYLQSGPPRQEEPHSVPAVWQALLPHPEEDLCLVQLPVAEDAPLCVVRAGAGPDAPAVAARRTSVGATLCSRPWRGPHPPSRGHCPHKRMECGTSHASGGRRRIGRPTALTRSRSRARQTTGARRPSAAARRGPGACST